MPPKTAGAIIERISKNWNLAPDAEITLEANPTSVEYGKFKDFKAAGINRVSIGVQSFDEAELKFLGREHSAAEALNAINYAAEIFDNYSFDLIYTLPQQTLKGWEAALNKALKLAKYHISLYQLTIEQNTNFYHRKVAIPEGDVAAQFYELTGQICADAGLPAYEISNYARAGFESRHNLTYWEYGDYLGIGPGAHGRYQGHATVMTKSPEKWLEQPLESSVTLTEQEKLEEAVLMGLRLAKGLPITFAPRLKNLEMLQKEGFLELSNQTIKPTPKGFLILNSVIEKLFDI